MNKEQALDKFVNFLLPLNPSVALNGCMGGIALWLASQKVSDNNNIAKQLLLYYQRVLWDKYHAGGYLRSELPAEIKFPLSNGLVEKEDEYASLVSQYLIESDLTIADGLKFLAEVQAVWMLICPREILDWWIGHKARKEDEYTKVFMDAMFIYMT